MNIGRTGSIGENKVASYLIKQGYAILKRNFVCRHGEIDIIAEHGEYIVFIEVKTRASDAMVSGLEAVDGYKQHRIIAAANYFLLKAQNLGEKNIRFDVAEVSTFKKPSGDIGYNLNYITNAF